MARLSDSEIDERLARGAWRREGDTIVRDIELGGFKAAMQLANKVADAANDANHHPDILVHDYKHLRLTLSTHSAGGITENDFALAGVIDELIAAGSAS
ncbi:MAG: 4a-hydroxytetrahydrobiopterin dehydratase [Solirubrobacterales bacterium]|nr:4a-hydroxytetrahydrobiopterin dehydratase [Solirubrobacterales bacterium]